MGLLQELNALNEAKKLDDLGQVIGKPKDFVFDITVSAGEEYDFTDKKPLVPLTKEHFEAVKNSISHVGQVTRAVLKDGKGDTKQINLAFVFKSHDNDEVDDSFEDGLADEIYNVIPTGYDVIVNLQ